MLMCENRPEYELNVTPLNQQPIYWLRSMKVFINNVSEAAELSQGNKK